MSAEQEIYTVFLTADPDFPVTFKNSTGKLEDFCTMSGAKILERQTPGEAIILMNSQSAETLSKNEFIEYLPIPGSYKAIMRGKITDITLLPGCAVDD